MSRSWTTCSQCGRRIDENAARTAYREDGEPFCATCTRAMSLPCVTCGRTYPQWDMFWSEEAQGCKCEKCNTGESHGKAV